MEIYIAKSGKESGPFNREQLASMHESGMVTLTDSVWHEGLEGWLPLHQFLGLRPPVPGQLQILAAVTHGGNVAVKKPAVSGDPAPFLKRLAAFLIDFVLCLIAGMLAGLLGGAVGNFVATIFGLQDTVPGLIVGTTLAITGYIAPGWFYHAYFESTDKQATFGKQLCGLIVTDLEGRKMDRKRASRRATFKVIFSMIPFGFLLFLTCLLNEQRQSLHDLLTGSLVVVK